MESMEKVNCESCGKDSSLEFVYDKCDCGIYKCPICGLGHAQPNFDFAADKYYEKEYFNGGLDDGYSEYEKTEIPLKKEFSRTLSYLDKYTTDHKTLLEMGCAYGFFLEQASKHYECHGIDVSQDGISKCKQKGLNVTHGSLTEGVLGDKKFDVAVLLDCIEHLTNPKENIKVLHESLNKNGILILTTGDWSSLMGRLLKKNWRLMTPPQHLFFFTKRSLTKLLNQQGFEVVAMDSPWKYVPLALIGYKIMNFLRLPIVEWKWLHRIGIYLNMFDVMRCVAKKKN